MILLKKSKFKLTETEYKAVLFREIEGSLVL